MLTMDTEHEIELAIRSKEDCRCRILPEVFKPYFDGDVIAAAMSTTGYGSADFTVLVESADGEDHWLYHRWGRSPNEVMGQTCCDVDADYVAKVQEAESNGQCLHDLADLWY